MHINRKAPATRILAAAATLFALSAGFAGNALADTYNLRSYFASLSNPYPTQTASNQWSFYAGSAVGGVLISPLGANYYGPETYQQIGALVDTGTNGIAGPTLNATFDGVFVHPGSANPTSVRLSRRQRDDGDTAQAVERNGW